MTEEPIPAEPVPTESTPSRRPQVKVAAAGVGGAVTTIVVAILEGAGVDVDAGLAAAIATIVAFASGYIVPPRGA